MPTLSNNHRYLLDAIERGVGVAELECAGLSPRTINQLEGGGIITLRELLYTSPKRLLTIKNIGPTTLKEIRRVVLRVGTRSAWTIPQ